MSAHNGNVAILLIFRGKDGPVETQAFVDEHLAGEGIKEFAREHVFNALSAAVPTQEQVVKIAQLAKTTREESADQIARKFHELTGIRFVIRTIPIKDYSR